MIGHGFRSSTQSTWLDMMFTYVNAMLAGQPSNLRWQRYDLFRKSPCKRQLNRPEIWCRKFNATFGSAKGCG
jgi:hypothetical protein